MDDKSGYPHKPPFGGKMSHGPTISDAEIHPDIHLAGSASICLGRLGRSLKNLQHEKVKPWE